MERNLKEESLSLCYKILEGHNYSFHMFRRIFVDTINSDDILCKYWYDNGDFRNMRLYKFLTDLGYRKQGTILVKIK